jgi:hypothetical protein
MLEGGLLLVDGKKVNEEGVKRGRWRGRAREK